MFVQQNNLNEIKQYFRKSLGDKFSENELKLIVKELTIKRFDINELDYILFDKRLSESDLLYYRSARLRLQENEPFQYIIGETTFYGLILKTDKRALIPRPETEELVDWVVMSIEKVDSPKIMDLCAGSGCIALAMKSKLFDADVTAVELSGDAIDLIKENIKRTGYEISVRQADVLNIEAFESFEPKSFDCWVSNPPYIPEQDKQSMRRNVLDFEPHIALFVKDDDPLVFYREIASAAQIFLKNNGLLFFEIHEELWREIERMLLGLGFVNIELRTDLQGKQRMIRAQKLHLPHG